MLHIVPDIDNSETLTERQKAVLDAALRLLVEEGDQLTMARSRRSRLATPR